MKLYHISVNKNEKSPPNDMRKISAILVHAV